MPKDFFGMKVTQDYITSQMTEVPFEISKYRFYEDHNDHRVEYYADYGNIDPSILAYAEIMGNQIYISVTNNSNTPISTNYFGDEFVITTKDTKFLYMEKCAISSSYPSEYINPGTTGRYCLRWWSFPVKSDVTSIVCTLGVIDKTIIILRPLPISNTVNIKAKKLNVAGIGTESKTKFAQYYNKGIEYYKQGNYDQAEEAFRKALELKPNHVYALYGLGNTYYCKAKYDEAVKIYMNAIKINPGYPKVHYSLSLAYIKLGRTHDAEREKELFRKLTEGEKNY